MGIIKAAAHAVGTGLADQWLEALEPDKMGAQTVFTKGVQIRKVKGENVKSNLLICLGKYSSNPL